ncbi:UNVERIFIED_CONTAM: 50S ribosomal protein 6, chloroplastic [Sesamum latifolium]|uniref:50S ribosomal protein 6, chloroplastic n=1 Tax=Sesamum latifolium TaxID=2727402 RepID=A0AAW2VU54_9LAMI
MKTRPRKTSPSDIRRRPTVYPPLPPLPPDWTLVSEDTSAPAPAPAPPEAVQSE